MKVIALVPAAGMGKRMGQPINKQYLLLRGKPILAHTLEIFEKAGCIDEIYVVIPEKEITFCRQEVVERYGLAKVRGIIAGGKERQHSVLNGLRALADAASDDVVLIHDGVRPFIPPSLIESAIETASVTDGALVAVPVKDTVKVVADGFVRHTPQRESLWLAQTPQAFRYGVIMDAHEAASRDRYLGTDDASLVERVGGKIRIVTGDYHNIKITTPEDLITAEIFLDELLPE